MWFLSPLNWLFIACALACAAWWLRRRRRLLMGSAVLLGCLAILAMTPLFANLLIGWLESEEKTPADCRVSMPRTAVVLAGGIDGRPSTDDDYSTLTLETRRRVERAVQWWHEQPGRSLVISGGPSRHGVPVSQVMAVYARALGVQADAIAIEGASQTTWENAQLLARMRPVLPRRVVLVTSSIHLRRARYSMEQAGFEVCGIATDPRFIPFELPGYLIPQSSAMTKTEKGLHEVVGLLYYHWLDFQTERDAARAYPGTHAKDAQE